MGLFVFSVLLFLCAKPFLPQSIYQQRVNGCFIVRRQILRPQDLCYTFTPFLPLFAACLRPVDSLFSILLFHIFFLLVSILLWDRALLFLSYILLYWFCGTFFWF